MTQRPRMLVEGHQARPGPGAAAERRGRQAQARPGTVPPSGDHRPRQARSAVQQPQDK
jgi:hypothetical protein